MKQVFRLIFCFFVTSKSESPRILVDMAHALDACNTFMRAALQCHPPMAKISKYSHRLSRVMLDAIHHYNIGKCDQKSKEKKRHKRQLNGQTLEDIERSFNEFLGQYQDSVKHGRDLQMADLRVFDPADIVTLENNITFLDSRMQNLHQRSIHMISQDDVIQDDQAYDYYYDFNGNLSRAVNVTDEARLNPIPPMIASRDFRELEETCRRKTRYVMSSGIFVDCQKRKKWQRRSEHLLKDMNRMMKTCKKHQINTLYSSEKGVTN